MEKVKLFTKNIVDETDTSYLLEYSLLICSAESGNVYGVEIIKKDSEGHMEKEKVSGFSESREEAEGFLFCLAEGFAFPSELISLCDDHQTKKEMDE